MPTPSGDIVPPGMGQEGHHKRETLHRLDSTVPSGCGGHFSMHLPTNVHLQRFLPIQTIHRKTAAQTWHRSEHSEPRSLVSGQDSLK